MEAEYNDILKQLKAAGDWAYARGLPDHPPFKSAPSAAERLLALAPPGTAMLVMRDQCLGPLRELMLRRSFTLITTDKCGERVFEIPSDALGTGRLRGATAKERGKLRLSQLPGCARPYAGKVDAIVVGCLAYEVGQPFLYSFDTDRTALTLENLVDGSSQGFTLDAATPVLCMASDAQEVSGWPSDARSSVAAHLVVTATRYVSLDNRDGR